VSAQIQASELWSSAAADARDAANLLQAPPDDSEAREHVFKVLQKLRSAVAAVQALERMLINGPPKIG
jgi:hypothetical protein